MPWYAWMVVFVLYIAVSYMLVWLTQLEAMIRMLTLEQSAIRVRLVGRSDGATLTETLNKGPNSITALKEFLNEPRGL